MDNMFTSGRKSGFLHTVSQTDSPFLFSLVITSACIYRGSDNLYLEKCNINFV